MKLSVKYLILSTLLFLFFGAYTQAQDRKFNFGIHISPNLSWLKPDVDGKGEVVYKSNGTRLLMGYGADFNYFFIPNIGIGTGVNVVYSGGKLEYNTHKINSDNDTIKGIMARNYKLQYLEIPLVLIGSTGDLMGKFSIYAKFGLGTSFKLKARSDDEFVAETTQVNTKEENINISSDVSFFRESLIVGIGGTYRLAKIISLNFCLTYNNGFTDILKGTNAININVKENAKDNYVELSVGLLF